MTELMTHHDRFAGPDVSATFDDASGAPEQEVTLTFSVSPESADNAEVGAYDIEVTYDESVVSFVSATGVDLPDPTVSQPSPGRVVANAAQTSGDPVPLTPAEFTFSIDEDASDGDSTDISFLPNESELTDPIDELSVDWEDGSISVVGDDPLWDYRVGDVDTDGEIDIVDVVRIQRHLAQLDPDPFAEELADVRRNGEIGIVDAVLVQQRLAEIRDPRFVEVTDLSADQSTVYADLQNTGGLGAWDEAELALTPQTDEAARIIEGYEAGDPVDLGEILPASTVKTAIFDTAPDGGQDSLEFDISDLSSGTYVGVVQTGDDSDQITFTV